MPLKLLRVMTGSLASKKFVAGVNVETGMVVSAAPILKKYIGLSEFKFRELCRMKAWGVEDV